MKLFAQPLTGPDTKLEKTFEEDKLPRICPPEELFGARLITTERMPNGAILVLAKPLQGKVSIIEDAGSLTEKRVMKISLETTSASKK